mmetsp:Transcript_39857/g.62988  ORF Transcript_39857/g.62988 Transcript_39857/m.62988 type:complete len:330 (-) Transcript_39857:9-998(-)
MKNNKEEAEEQEEEENKKKSSSSKKRRKKKKNAATATQGSTEEKEKQGEKETEKKKEKTEEEEKEEEKKPKNRSNKKQKEAKCLFSKYAVVLLGVIVTVWVIWMSFRTFERNYDWTSDKTLFYSAVQTCPESAKMHRQLSQIYVSEKKPDLVIKHLTKAREIDPDYCELNADFGLYYYSQNNVREFLTETRKATLCRFTAEKALQNLQEIYTKVLFPMKEPWAYREYADTMLDLNATEIASTYYREAGVLAFKKGEAALALQYLLKSDQIYERCDVWWWIAQIYESQDRPSDAKQLYIKAAECTGYEEESAKRAAIGSLQLLMAKYPNI